MMKTNWEGKTVILTGAAGGIGSAVCRKLMSYRMNLVLVGRKQQPLEQLAEEAKEKGCSAVVCAGDVTRQAFRQELFCCLQEHFGALDLLINNAGMAQHCPVEEMTEEQFDQIMAINTKAPYFLCQQALPLLRRSSVATIINIGSVVSHKGYPQQSVYAASKHALLGLSKSLANEVYRENIRVHVISPGGVYTPMAALARPDLRPDMLTLPEDIADIVAFYLDHRDANAVIDEIQVHRSGKEPFA